MSAMIRVFALLALLVPGVSIAPSVASAQPIPGAGCPKNASPCTVKATGGTTGQSLATLAADIADVRAFGAVCDGTNNGVTTAVNLAVTAGYKKVFLPKNCFYVPTANTTPANVRIIGEDWQTSTISVAVRATDNILMGTHSSMENVATISNFCDQSTSPAATLKVCPVGVAQNISDSTSTLSAWPYLALYAIAGATSTNPIGSVATDVPIVQLIGLSSGGDNIYTQTGSDIGPVDAAGSSGIRVVTAGSGDRGIQILNGLLGASSRSHLGIYAKEFGSNATGYTVEIDRVGDGTNVAPSLEITDIDSAGSTNTRPFIDISAVHQSSGPLLNIFGGTTAFSGGGILINLGNSAAAFTGSFIEFKNAGTQKYVIDSGGNTTSQGYIQVSQGLVSGSPTGGAVSTSVNIAGSYLKNNVGIILAGTTGSIGGGALAAGACTSGTVAVTNSTTAMSVAVSPVAQPQADATHGLSIWGFVSSAGTVTVEVCAIVATTPVATTYNVRVMQ